MRTLPTRTAAALFFCLGAGACSSAKDSGTSPAAEAAREGGFDPTPVGGARPAKVYVPGSYRAGTATPLVVLLHGYHASGQLQDALFGLQAVAEERGFLYIHPDGTPDKMSARFWNATDACCNGDNLDVDDSAYITGLIDETASRFSVDPKRVFITGHSNGGFMSYRMACDHADKVAAVAVLAGAMWKDVSRCKPSGPVSVLHIHGDQDDTVLYAGSTALLQGAAYPSAQVSVEDWVSFNGCSPTVDTSAAPLDLDPDLPAGAAGPETTVARYSGCKPGGAAELWTMKGAGHVPSLAPSFSRSIVDFFLAHPKP